MIRMDPPVSTTIPPGEHVTEPSGADRRAFLSATAALGLGALASSRVASVFARTPPAPGSLIDVHHHFVPPFYLAENRTRIETASGGRIHPAWMAWSAEQALAAMDARGVATAILSLTFPGVWFGDDPRAATRTARRVNEFAADLVRSHPGRFGLFAAVPLPDAEASLGEIEYALGALKADGIGLLTSYGDKWLGDAAYRAVFEELDRRRAVVFVHPATPSCCRTLLPDVAPMVAEIPQDTTRAVTNLLFTGTLSRFTGIRFVFTHAGGSVPMVAGRMQQYAPPNIAEKAPQGIEYELRRLYYDIAGTAYRPAIAALMALVPATQVLFGSDNPYVPLAETAAGLAELGLSAADVELIGRKNALALFPRLETST
jgi:predicted TIM-barrel fold metal-dependent hydrolase